MSLLSGICGAKDHQLLPRLCGHHHQDRQQPGHAHPGHQEEQRRGRRLGVQREDESARLRLPGPAGWRWLPGPGRRTPGGGQTTGPELCSLRTLVLGPGLVSMEVVDTSLNLCFLSRTNNVRTTVTAAGIQQEGIMFKSKQSTRNPTRGRCWWRGYNSTKVAQSRLISARPEVPRLRRATEDRQRQRFRRRTRRSLQRSIGRRSRSGPETLIQGAEAIEGIRGHSASAELGL